jgi:RHS repeat-associated protein
VHRVVTYGYDHDLNRAGVSYPGSDTFSYTYTNREQLASVLDTTTSSSPISYSYDLDGNATSETEGGVVAMSATFNAMNRATHLSRSLVGGARTFDYLHNVMNDRTSIQQDGGAAKTYTYDLAEQSDTETISGVGTTFNYDANGNRTGVNGSGTYATNNLNEYTTFNGSPVTYDSNGNLTSYNGWTYVYDAQNRMVSATNGTTTETFAYDGLNRKISQTVGGATTFNVWDGWNLIEEFAPSATTPTYSYIYGARNEIVERLSGAGNILYFQDAVGNTTHAANASGGLLESYTYSRSGLPSFFNASGSPIGSSSYDVRHLFHGQLWNPSTGLNDYKNRIQLPTMAVFMQTDPIRFNGDATHLYRFCGNNSFNMTDPDGELALLGGAIGYAAGYVGGYIEGYVGQLGSGQPIDYDAINNAAARGASVGFGVGLLFGSAVPDPSDIAELVAAGVIGGLYDLSQPHSAASTSTSSSPSIGLAPTVTVESVGIYEDTGFTVVLFSDGSTRYNDVNGGHGYYDAQGNGYWIWDPNGNVGDVVGQDTNGNPIIQQGGGFDGGGYNGGGNNGGGNNGDDGTGGGQGDAGGPGPSPGEQFSAGYGFAWWGGTTASRIPWR